MKSNTKDCQNANDHSAFLKNYRDHFAIEYANNEFLQAFAFRLRHQVYCVENQFEPIRPDRLEKDLFGQHAKHALLKHRTTSHYVGYVRLILPHANNLKQSLPLFAICNDIAIEKFPTDKTAEISRFLLSQEMIQCIVAINPSETQLRVFAHTLFSLLSAILAMAIENHITHLCALLDKRLMQFIRKIGLEFEVLGPMIQHHGPRLPICIPTDKLVDYFKSQWHD